MTTGPRLDRPLLFAPNRVWRCYTGGLLLDRFQGAAAPSDGPLPEEWLASTTRAQNGPRARHPDEGLSRVRLSDGNPGPLLAELVAKNPAECLGSPGEGGGLGVLCKFLDSAIRLPIQCHPDRAFARAHYKSPHGKEEAWFVLGTRAVGGVDPYLLIGFTPEADPDTFARAVRAQDVAARERMLHRFPVRPGDAFFIPGRIPHAIGPGVFLLEVQEPTDWVVQPERFVGETELSATDMWGPVTPEVGLACFEFDGRGTADAIAARVRMAPTVVSDGPGGRVERLDAPERPCFRVDRLTVTKELAMEADLPWHVAVVTAGRGVVMSKGGTDAIRQGDHLFVPHAAGAVRYAAGEPLAIYVVSTATR